MTATGPELRAGIKAGRFTKIERATWYWTLGGIWSEHLYLLYARWRLSIFELARINAVEFDGTLAMSAWLNLWGVDPKEAAAGRRRAGPQGKGAKERIRGSGSTAVGCDDGGAYRVDRWTVANSGTVRVSVSYSWRLRRNHNRAKRRGKLRLRPDPRLPGFASPLQSASTQLECDERMTCASAGPLADDPQGPSLHLTVRRLPGACSPSAPAAQIAVPGSRRSGACLPAYRCSPPTMRTSSRTRAVFAEPSLPMSP